jgi:tryptophan synthase alpha chain
MDGVIGASVRHGRAGEQRIADAFAASRLDGRAALMPFLMGGFPSRHACRDIARAYVSAGVDLVELGIPCSAPAADGPVIRAAGNAALRAGISVDDVLDIARAVPSRVPVVIMCYAQVLFTYGAESFVAALCDAGVSGLIVPDLAPQQCTPLLQACDAARIALVPVLAPSAQTDSVGQLATRARGFVYAAAVNGTTGERSVLSPDVPALIRRAKATCTLPVALGFGISTPEHAALAAAAGADGVIVGSRLVRAAAQAVDPAAAVGDVLAGLLAALRDQRTSDQHAFSAATTRSACRRRWKTSAPQTTGATGPGGR